jgi:hypothetical protein
MKTIAKNGDLKEVALERRDARLNKASISTEFIHLFITACLANHTSDLF